MIHTRMGTCAGGHGHTRNKIPPQLITQSYIPFKHLDTFHAAAIFRHRCTLRVGNLNVGIMSSRH